jgi:RNA polymerase sigma-70 factor (family 1)
VPSRPQETAREFVQSFQEGEEKGFNFFFRQYYAAICYFSFQITRDKEAAKEIAGDAFTKLWENRIRFDNASSIKSFLFTVTRNASLNKIKLQKRNTQREKEFLYLTNETESSIFQKKIETELYGEIFSMLNTLPPKCRQIFNMLYIQGKSYEEISQELNLSINNIRNQKARGLMLLKQRIALSILFMSFLGHFI